MSKCLFWFPSYQMCIFITINYSVADFFQYRISLKGVLSNTDQHSLQTKEFGRCCLLSKQSDANSRITEM